MTLDFLSAFSEFYFCACRSSLVLKLRLEVLLVLLVVGVALGRGLPTSTASSAHIPRIWRAVRATHRARMGNTELGEAEVGVGSQFCLSTLWTQAGGQDRFPHPLCLRGKNGPASH